MRWAGVHLMFKLKVSSRSAPESRTYVGRLDSCPSRIAYPENKIKLSARLIFGVSSDSLDQQINSF